jgi:D-alanine--poly(phosphoribitol) ligase subunit 2
VENLSEAVQTSQTSIVGDDVLNIIYDVIDELNETLPEGQRLAKSPDTLLFGGGANLESLGLVRLVLLLEQKVQDDMGRTVTLVNEKAMSQSRSPFRTVAALADYVAVVLGQESDV